MSDQEASSKARRPWVWVAGVAAVTAAAVGILFSLGGPDPDSAVAKASKRYLDMQKMTDFKCSEAKGGKQGAGSTFNCTWEAGNSGRHRAMWAVSGNDAFRISGAGSHRNAPRIPAEAATWLADEPAQGRVVGTPVDVVFGCRRPLGEPAPGLTTYDCSLGQTTKLARRFDLTWNERGDLVSAHRSKASTVEFTGDASPGSTDPTMVTPRGIGLITLGTTRADLTRIATPLANDMFQAGKVKVHVIYEDPVGSTEDRIDPAEQQAYILTAESPARDWNHLTFRSSAEQFKSASYFTNECNYRGEYWFSANLPGDSYATGTHSYGDPFTFYPSVNWNVWGKGRDRSGSVQVRKDMSPPSPSTMTCEQEYAAMKDPYY